MAVRSFDESTAWVLNHLGDSVTVVDLDNERVLATLNTGAEPADVVFSGTPVRAFVSISQENRVMVFDPAGADSTPVNANCGPDLNRDGRVDGLDLGLLFSAWGPCGGGDCPADLTGNGTVGLDDLGVLLAGWSD